MISLTPRQQEIFDWIRNHLAQTGMPPTRLELCRAMGFRSPNAAEDHLRALARKGFLELLPGASRGIRLIAPEVSDPEEVGLPVIGRVAAGVPLLAIEHIESHLNIDPAAFHPMAHYLLNVRGDSMTGVGILDGDLLAVHRTSQAESGQIIVARVDDEVTVKRYKPQGSTVVLEPENPHHRALVVDLAEHEFAIEGLAVGLIRQSWRR